MLYPPITPARFAAALGAAHLLFDVEPKVLLRRSRSQRLTPARQALIAALADACGATCGELAACLNRDRATVRYHLAQSARRASADAEYAAAVALIAREIRSAKEAA